MRLITVLALGLAAAPLAAQDFVRDRQTLGSDTTFGPGITEVSASGAAIRLQLARPAHVFTVVFTPTTAPRIVEPRRSESREMNGRPWIDLFPMSASSDASASGPSMRSSASGYGGGGSSRAADSRTAANASVAYRGAGNTVALVVLSDQKWELRQLEPLLPPQAYDPVDAARQLVTAITRDREGAWVGYLVRY